MARRKKLDFSNVEQFSKASEGRHRVKIKEINEQTSQGGDDMLVFVFEVIKGDDKGALIYENCVLTDKALWKLQQILQAIGIKCNGKVAIDLDKLIGKICEVDVFHEEYEGRTRAKIGEYFKVKAAKADDDEDETDDEDEEEEEEKPVKKPTKKTAAKGRKKPEEDDDEEDDDDEDDEEEEAPPRRKAKVTKKPAKKPAKSSKKSKPVDDEDEDDDEDDDDDWDDDDDE